MAVWFTEKLSRVKDFYFQIESIAEAEESYHDENRLISYGGCNIPVKEEIFNEDDPLAL